VIGEADVNSLVQPHGKIDNEWHLLQRQWQVTTGLWNDAARHRFEREFIQGYEPTVLTTLKELDKLTQVIAQAQREVK
jgi:hypothetical protein